MPGLYQRDNLAQQLAQAIELAQQRRERNRAIEAQRNSENVKAATDFAKALGRTYESWDSKDDEEKLAVLQEERAQALEAHDNEMRSMFHQVEPSYDSDYAKAMLGRDMVGYVPMSKYTDAMSGYVPAANYNDIIKRRGLL